MREQGEPASLPSRSFLWHHAPLLETGMAHLLEFVGSVHIYLGPYRGNPISLYLKSDGNRLPDRPEGLSVE